MYKTVLRYPGGKGRSIQQIAKYIPDNIEEYREPLVGGGAVYFYIREKYPKAFCWINDINTELYYFWFQVSYNIEQLVEEIKKIKQEEKDGKLLFKRLVSLDIQKLTPLQRAIRFFVLNRISFSGLIDNGGYSQASFEGRFTDSCIEKLLTLKNYFLNTCITNNDYAGLLEMEELKTGNNVFIYLDPPYYSNKKSKLYGTSGKLHTEFDHIRFAETAIKCNHKWLITYDDCDEIRNLFSSFYIYDWDCQYSMNNYKQNNCKKGKELFITNYKVF